MKGLQIDRNLIFRSKNNLQKHRYLVFAHHVKITGQSHPDSLKNAQLNSRPHEVQNLLELLHSSFPVTLQLFVMRLSVGNDARVFCSIYKHDSITFYSQLFCPSIYFDSQQIRKKISCSLTGSSSEK